MNITIIGTGKLGCSVSTLLKISNIPHQLLGRQDEYRCAGLVYICVPESQIALVSSKIKGAAIVLHSAGSLDADILIPHPIRGVLHPIMSFSDPKLALPEAPIPATLSGLKDHPEQAEIVNVFAQKIGFQIYPYQGSRALYHSAAVISGNFATILLHAGATVLESQGSNYQDALSLLQPLALQSVANANKGSLSEVLSGPLARGELETLDKQIKALASIYPSLAELMETFKRVHQDLSRKS